MLLIIQSKLIKHDRQYRFKKGIGCNSALFTVKSIVNHFIKNDSTINICSIDLIKAFDKVNIDILLEKLCDRNVPVSYINVLRCWYSKVLSTVKWGTATSEFYKHCLLAFAKEEFCHLFYLEFMLMTS